MRLKINHYVLIIGTNRFYSIEECEIIYIYIFVQTWNKFNKIHKSRTSFWIGYYIIHRVSKSTYHTLDTCIVSYVPLVCPFMHDCLDTQPDTWRKKGVMSDGLKVTTGTFQDFLFAFSKFFNLLCHCSCILRAYVYQLCMFASMTYVRVRVFISYVWVFVSMSYVLVTYVYHLYLSVRVIVYILFYQLFSLCANVLKS